MKSKSPGLATFLSFLITGGGQFYNGDVVKGIGMLLGALFLGVITYGILGIPFWIWSMVDASKSAKKINELAQMDKQNAITRDRNMFEVPINDTRELPRQDYNYSNYSQPVNQIVNQSTNIPKAFPEENKIKETAGALNLNENSRNSSETSKAEIEFVKTIEKYKKLYDEDLFTYMEFSQKKEQLISDLENSIPSNRVEDFLISISPFIKNNAISQEELQKIKIAIKI